MTCCRSHGIRLIAPALLAAALLSAYANDFEPPPTGDPSSTPAAIIPVQAEAGGIDPDSGLVIDRHWELVRGHCGACHSPKLVTQNRGSRATWLQMIHWMQETQGLWPLDAATETAILDYLEKNYAPQARGRRAAVPPHLMPKNPYPASNG